MDHKKYTCSCGYETTDLEVFFRHVYKHVPNGHDQATRLIAYMKDNQLVIVPACECQICRPIN